LSNITSKYTNGTHRKNQFSDNRSALFNYVGVSRHVFSSCFLPKAIAHNLPYLNAESAPKNNRPYLGFVSREGLSLYYTPNVSSPCALISIYIRICSSHKTREGTYVSSCVSVRYLKNVRICACGDHSTWTRPQRGAGVDICESRIFTCKSVSPVKVERTWCRRCVW